MGIQADTLYEVLSNSYGQSRIYERNYMEYMKMIIMSQAFRQIY